MKLRYGCLRPDVEQSGTLQEQLLVEPAIVVIVVSSSSSFYWRIHHSVSISPPKLLLETTGSSITLLCICGSRTCDIGLSHYSRVSDCMHLRICMPET